MSQVQSRDGTIIDYDQSGQGPALILVASALAARDETEKLAALLADKFTVLNYDRRGRGKSGDTPPYSVEREIEDVAALMEATGGSAALFGSSSGAILALEAARALPGRVTCIALFEPPLILDAGRAAIPAAFRGQVEAKLAAGDRPGAVKLFYRTALGIPGPFVALMPLVNPFWKASVALAHTLPYDIALCAPYQRGEALAADGWGGLEAPALLLTGEKSEAFFHSGAAALAGLMPRGEHRVLAGADHSSVVMNPAVVAAALIGFLPAG